MKLGGLKNLDQALNHENLEVRDNQFNRIGNEIIEQIQLDILSSHLLSYPQICALVNGSHYSRELKAVLERCCGTLIRQGEAVDISNVTPIIEHLSQQTEEGVI